MSNLPKKVQKVADACKVAFDILQELVDYTEVGMTYFDIDKKAAELMKEKKCHLPC